jgi:peptidoglycan/LPS O-acetylase OafA/YrhL
MLLGYTMLPLPVSMDIRGWREMYPLNGPAWSLFFEYIANFVYAVWVRHFSKRQLTLFVILAAVFLLQYLLMGSHDDDVIGGWSVDRTQLHIGFARLLYPFFAGVLLMRMGKSIPIKRAFPICSLVLIVVLAFPRVGGEQHLWMNGLYESICILLVFPLIVVLGAGGEIRDQKTLKICKLLGALSYPLYILHFPLIYIYWAWVKDNKIPMPHGLWVGLALLITAIAMAIVALKFYDEPVRKWLTRKFLSRKSDKTQESYGIAPTGV